MSPGDGGGVVGEEHSTENVSNICLCVFSLNLDNGITGWHPGVMPREDLGSGLRLN